MFNFSKFTQIRLVTFSAYLKRIWYRSSNVCKFIKQKDETKKQVKNFNCSVVENIQNVASEHFAFEKYYKAQKICPEEEWSTFMQMLQEGLPIAFRVITYKPEAAALKDFIESENFTQILNTGLQDDKEEREIKPINLHWYPGSYAWHLHLSRTEFCRDEATLRLQTFLAEETAAGGISRQEAVSMMPPIVLDVKPHHTVLDMCAAPGSKTIQLIEFLHAEKDTMPTGFILANEVDRNRCHVLINRIKRLESPCIVVSNHNAATMPSMMITDEQNPNSTKPLKFDRILCDVPCSGDAIIRKKPDLLLKWNPLTAYCLHGRQYRILKRGCELLSVGGRLVYSTCSFNPIENEAVIHRMLQDAGDSLKLVEVSDLLPRLKFNKGLSYWRLASKDMGFYENYEDVPTNWQYVIRPSMFPPKQNNMSKYNLDKCIRILPHHQNTGGFFIAVLEKTSPLPWEAEQKNVINKKNKRPKKTQKIDGSKDQFIFFSNENEDVLTSIKKYYELREEFDPMCLLTRCRVGKKNNIYLVSPRVKDLIRNNEANIKIINTGIRTFVRFCGDNKMECAFKLSQEGLRTIAPFVGASRRVRILKDDLILLLQRKDPSDPPHLKLFSEYTQSQVKDLTISSCVVEYKDMKSKLELTLVGFRGLNFLKTNIEDEQAVHYLRLLGADHSMYDLKKFKKHDIDANNENNYSENGYINSRE